MTLKDEPPRSVGVQYATREQLRNSTRKNEEAEPKQKHAQLWMCLVGYSPWDFPWQEYWNG